MQPTKPTKTIDKNILMQPTKPTKTIDKTGREEKKKKSPVVITWILVCIVKIVRFSTFYFFYILVLKTLVNIFEITKKSDSVEFLSPG